MKLEFQSGSAPFFSSRPGLFPQALGTTSEAGLRAGRPKSHWGCDLRVPVCVIAVLDAETVRDSTLTRVEFI